ncbi:MAG: DinB family protein [Pelobium sp.]
MEKQFEIFKKTRIYLLSYIADLTVKQLNTTPKGFKNNIIWNVGHMIAAQQGVCYRRVGLPFTVNEEVFDLYKPDTTPQEAVDEGGVAQLKKLLLTTIDEMQRDYDKGLFSKYPAWTNRYGIELATIEQTINFLLLHDGIHLGMIMSLKKLV